MIQVFQMIKNQHIVSLNTDFIHLSLSNLKKIKLAKYKKNRETIFNNQIINNNVFERENN